ncbi:MAG: transposase [Candidatus Marinimicrobia bacterium]|nr:transposase [Candidatus Neomarinimicrobiota bacterium]MCH7763803.1 transposase [Candidatus Neomarinimicrobiota bacterium]
MSKNRRNHSAAFKARVALEAIKGEKTMSELSSFYVLNPAQIQKFTCHSFSIDGCA